MNPEFSRLFFNYPNVNFHENLFGGSRAVPCGSRDEHDEADRRFSQFYKEAYKIEVVFK